MKQLAEVRTLRVNRYMIIDDEPCKIMSISTSKPGKHGESKARIEAIGIFDNQKRPHVGPVSMQVHIPLIDKRTGQVISMSGEIVQIMDSETFETVDVSMIDDEVKGKVENGQNVESKSGCKFETRQYKQSF